MKTVVTIVGSGTCVPSLERSACSVMVESRGRRVLLDSGPGTMHRLLEAGVRIFDIDLIGYSHFHPDHTGELVPILFATKYSGQGPRKRPLTLVAGKGFNDFFSRLHRVYGDWITLGPGQLEIIELDNLRPDSFRYEELMISSMPVEHQAESLAFRITDPDGRSIVYSGDTDFSENLIRLAKNTDLLVCESAFPDARKTRGHLTPSLSGKIARMAGVRKLVLTHLYPECDGVDLVGQCRRNFDGPVLIARDLMRIEL